jgi:membrane-associated protease RseP (regulator of RpoE activity)
MRFSMTSGLMAAVLAALPATAMARPDGSQSQDQSEQNQAADENSQPAPATGQKSPEFDRFEWTQTSGPRLGITIIGLTPELRAFYGAPKDRGVVVAHVEPRSPAARAGLRVGDILIGVQGESIASASDVLGALWSINRGERVPLTVIRNDETVRLQAMLPSSKPMAPEAEADDC